MGQRKAEGELKFDMNSALESASSLRVIEVKKKIVLKYILHVDLYNKLRGDLIRIKVATIQLQNRFSSRLMSKNVKIRIFSLCLYCFTPLWSLADFSIYS
jgi:hypothetical protein